MKSIVTSYSLSALRGTEMSSVFRAMSRKDNRIKGKKDLQERVGSFPEEKAESLPSIPSPRLTAAFWWGERLVLEGEDGHLKVL